MQHNEHMLKCSDVLLKNFLIYSLKKECLYSRYSSFLVINICNQGKTLCSPCTESAQFFLPHFVHIKINVNEM